MLICKMWIYKGRNSVTYTYQAQTFAARILVVQTFAERT